jgi:phosphohistidine phosphatase
LRLFLIRHADAEAGDPDELRRLSPEGREQARALGEQLAADGVQADAVLTSPLLRARETGEALAPGATAASVRAAVEGRGQTVIVVGHQPDCSQIAAELSNGPEPRFPPAGMVELQVPDPDTS